MLVGFFELNNRIGLFLVLFFDCGYHICFIVKSLFCALVYYIKDSSYWSYYLIIIWLTDTLNLLLQSILTQNFQLILEYFLVVLRKKFLVRKVYTDLLERIFLEIFKTKNIQEVDLVINWFIIVLLIVRTENYLYFINDCLEKTVINGLS